MFRVEMLPAGKGDALWLEYGNEDAPTRMLIDGGYASTVKRQRGRIERLAADAGGRLAFELLVVSHIDADHIAGAIEILGNPSEYPIDFGDIWFNGWWMLPDEGAELADWAARTGIPDDFLGGQHGEYLDLILDARDDLPLNAIEEGRPIFVGTEAKPRTLTLPSGMKLTLLSPTFERLRALTKTWARDAANMGLHRSEDVAARLRDRNLIDDDVSDMLGAPPSDMLGGKPTGEIPLGLDGLLVDETKDGSNPNGASIAFIAEHEGRSVLLAADAHNGVLAHSLSQLAGPDGRVKVDAVKMPHHGSKNNTAESWLRWVDTRVVMFSTNGAGSHYHPDREAVARVVAGEWRGDRSVPLELVFNYRSDTTDVWDRAELKQKYNYQAYYPTAAIDTKGSPGIAIDLATAPR
ncbi:MAG: hypothetical protein AAF721_22660 [Myxococcota bacterium]